jgi:hypothetical protein
VFIFSVYEYDSGDRTTTYIGILNHFIELMWKNKIPNQC